MKKNIIFVITDQQSASMLSCAGNLNLETPAMDYFAKNGVRFNRAYCSNPVCLPSRFSMLTGQMPSAINLRSNEYQNEITGIPKKLLDNGIGYLFKNANYDAVYGGKVHLPGITPENLGFDVISKDERQQLSDDCSAYIKNNKQDKPFLMVASFINPHDICYMALNETENMYDATIDDNDLLSNKELRSQLTSPEQMLKVIKEKHKFSSQAFYTQECPPLPDNYHPQENEPEAVGFALDQRPFRRNAREQFSDEKWKLHRWMYCRLTEKVDSEINQLIKAVKERNLEKDTVFIFVSDHGDHDSSHKLEHKTILYEEAIKVPFIIADIDQTEVKNMVDDHHLVSTGLDIIPTLCEYAGIAIDRSLKGVSLKPLIDDQSVTNWRKAIPVESEFGKGIVTNNMKYVLYDKGQHREQLYDLINDPHETRNFAYDEDKQDILNCLRGEFSKFYEINDF